MTEVARQRIDRNTEHDLIAYNVPKIHQPAFYHTVIDVVIVFRIFLHASRVINKKASIR